MLNVEVAKRYLYPRLNALPHILVFGEVHSNDFCLDGVLLLDLLGHVVKLVLAAADQHNVHALLGKVQAEAFACIKKLVSRGVSSNKSSILDEIVIAMQKIIIAKAPQRLV